VITAGAPGLQLLAVPRACIPLLNDEKTGLASNCKVMARSKGEASARARMFETTPAGGRPLPIVVPEMAGARTCCRAILFHLQAAAPATRRCANLGRICLVSERQAGVIDRPP